MPSRQIGFRSGDEADALESRGGQTAETIRRIIVRYSAALAAELRRVELSEPEWNVLRNVLNGTFVEDTTIRLLWAEVEDSRPDGHAEANGVDLDTLVGKLRGLTYTQSLAVIDAVERWWVAYNRH